MVHARAPPARISSFFYLFLLPPMSFFPPIEEAYSSSFFRPLSPENMADIDPLLEIIGESDPVAAHGIKAMQMVTDSLRPSCPPAHELLEAPRH
jgi:hypothetical protein